MLLFTYIVKKIGYALSGVYYGLRKEFSLRAHLLITLPLALIVGYLGWPLTQLDFLLITLAYSLLMITELQNTALEYALNRLHPEMHSAIGRSKDMAAGAVLIAGLFAIVVAIAIIWF